jgi:hypothetical protein
MAPLKNNLSIMVHKHFYKRSNNHNGKTRYSCDFARHPTPQFHGESTQQRRQRQPKDKIVDRQIP